MKTFYRCRFRILETALAPGETLQNGHRTLEECYHSVSESIQIGVEEAAYCDRSHASGCKILGLAANGSNLDVRPTVLPIDGKYLSYAYELERPLNDAQMEFGQMAQVHWVDRGDDKIFVTHALTPRELVIARPALRSDDEPSCRSCGSPRVFCGECLAFRGSCGKCGNKLTRSDLYTSVSDSRKRRGLPEIAFYEELLVADDWTYDLAVSPSFRGGSPPGVYYSEKLLDFIRDLVGCQIAVSAIPTLSRAEYREILTAIGAL